MHQFVIFKTKWLSIDHASISGEWALKVFDVLFRALHKSENRLYEYVVTVECETTLADENWQTHTIMFELYVKMLSDRKWSSRAMADMRLPLISSSIASKANKTNKPAIRRCNFFFRLNRRNRQHTHTLKKTVAIAASSI